MDYKSNSKVVHIEVLESCQFDYLRQNKTTLESSQWQNMQGRDHI